MSLRIVIADDHAMVLEGLRALLSLEPDIEIVALCKDGEETVEAVESTRPDVLVVDGRMPTLDGLGSLERLQKDGLEVPTILLTARMDDPTLHRALELGAEGLVLKESAPGELLEAIRAVAAGRRWIPESLSERALSFFQTGREAPAGPLTPRELEVVRLVASGRSNKRAAAELDITVRTIKQHLHSAYNKLGVSNRVQLSLLARERDWI